MWFVYLIGIILTYNAWKLHVKRDVFLRLNALKTAKEIIAEYHQLSPVREIIVQLPAAQVEKIPEELAEAFEELNRELPTK